jgi:hypothetical protein
MKDKMIDELGSKEDRKTLEPDTTVIDAVKELTKQIIDLTKTVNAMKETHDKWVRAGKF